MFEKKFYKLGPCLRHQIKEYPKLREWILKAVDETIKDILSKDASAFDSPVAGLFTAHSFQLPCVFVGLSGAFTVDVEVHKDKNIIGVLLENANKNPGYWQKKFPPLAPDGN